MAAWRGGCSDASIHTGPSDIETGGLQPAWRGGYSDASVRTSLSDRKISGTVVKRRLDFTGRQKE